MSKNKSVVVDHDITAVASLGAFYLMLPACVFVSVLDVYAWIMLRDFEKAMMSVLLACLFWRVLYAMRELERQMFDPSVSKLQFSKYCLKLVLPFVFKSFKD